MITEKREYIVARFADILDAEDAMIYENEKECNTHRARLILEMLEIYDREKNR